MKDDLIFSRTTSVWRKWLYVLTSLFVLTWLTLSLILILDSEEELPVEDEFAETFRSLPLGSSESECVSALGPPAVVSESSLENPACARVLSWKGRGHTYVAGFDAEGKLVLTKSSHSEWRRREPLDSGANELVIYP